ncbi:MAG: SurA N-terminal domain-containing protein [Candidatus Aminicenantes bacterium]|nr:SurA N-terminal domain-containing protein [Candidatus Aminicenantes bacterium]
MLRTMRQNMKSLKIVLWFIVAAFIVSIFVIWGGSGRLGEGQAGSVVATIGRHKIPTDEFLTGLRNRIESLKRDMKEIDRTVIEQLNLPQQVLEQIIEQRLLFDVADGLGIKASNAEVRERIMALPGLQRDGKFIGYDEYKRVLSYNRIPLSQFEGGIRQEIILSKTVAALTAGIVVTPQEVWDGYRLSKDTAKIEYLALESATITLAQAPDEAAVKAYFEGRKDAYKLPERREAGYVFIKNDDLKAEVELAEAEIAKYYQDNKAQFENPEQVKISRIFLPFAGKDKALVQAEAKSAHDRLQGGGDFAELAKAVSKDTKASAGGDWGLYDWRTLNPKEIEAVAKLALNKISDPIELADGIAILKVTQKDAAATTSLETAKPRIRTILQDQKARELAGQRMATLEKEARKAKSLEAAAKAANLKVQSTGLLKSGEALGDVDPAGSIASALFGLKDKDISAPLATYGGVALAELRKIEAPRPATFEEVKAQVATDLADALKKDLALAKIKEIRAKLNDKNWEDVAAAAKLEVKTVAEHKKEQYLSVIGESPETDNLAFSLPLKEISQPIDFKTGYAVMRVLARTEAVKEEFEKTKATETASLLEQKKNKFLQAYLAKLRGEKDIKIRYDAFLKASQDVLARYEKSGTGSTTN